LRWLLNTKTLTGQIRSLLSGAFFLLACLRDQDRGGFFGGPAFFNQSELFEYFTNCSDWLDGGRPSGGGGGTFVLIM